MEHQHPAGADDAAEHHPLEQAKKPWRRACHVGRRQRGIVFASILLLVAPLSLHGDSVTLDNARMSSYSPHMRSLKGFSDGGMCRIGTASWEPATPAQSQLRLRGGKGEVSAKAQSKSTTRSGSPKGKGKGWSASTKKVVKKKRLQKPHNLGPAEWMKKIKRPELQRREVSLKGFAKGRKKPVFHFWTKSKIKKFTEQRVAFRAKRRARFEKVQNQLEGCNKAEIIHCYARGWKTKFVKWLPSAAEQRALDETAAKEAEAAAAKVLEERETAGGEGDGEGGEGEDGGGGEGADEEGGGAAPKAAAGTDEPEDDFMMGGFGGGSDDSGLF